MKLGEAPKVDIGAISTGSLGLDMALGIGGVPRGRIIEIFGPESSGKTTLALHIVAEAQKLGGICAYIDAEHAMDPDYATKLGVKINDLLISQPDTGEQGLEITESLVRSGKIDVVVVDSVAALTPKDEIEGDMGQAHVGKQARLMSQALRKLTAIVARSKTLVIFINQIRMQIGVMFGNPETTPGGKALKFYSSVRLDIRRIAQLTKSISDLKIGGTGLFAMSITGRKEKPLYAGKVQFKGVHGLVADLPLSDFTGTVTFDDRRIDVPNLKGKIVDGALSMDLTVKDYLRSPDVLLEAKLDRFDLGRWLAAQSKVSEERKKRGQAQSPNVATKPLTVSTRGHWDIGLLSHPRATVSDVKVAWDLRGVSSDFRILNGDATFHVGEGNIHSLGDVAAQSKLVKVLVFPLLIVQNIGRLGGIKLFPNFNDIKLHHVIGDYIFRNGIMNLRQSEMDSDAAHVSAQGTIDLPGENLDLVMTAQVANFAPIDVGVKGTFANPKTKVDIGKFLAEPAKQLIQGLNKALVGEKVAN
jgi:RecA/RadA recombinase